VVTYPASDQVKIPGGSYIALPDEWEAYRLDTDPYELHNMWNPESPTLQALAMRLEAMIAAGAWVP
jgi:hypothetical protein